MVTPRANYFERYPKAGELIRKDANEGKSSNGAGDGQEGVVEGLGIQAESTELVGLFPLEPESIGLGFGSNTLSPSIPTPRRPSEYPTGYTPAPSTLLAPNPISSSPRNRQSSRLASPLRLKPMDDQPDDIFSPVSAKPADSKSGGSLSPRKIIFPSSPRSPRSPRFSGSPSTNSDGTISPPTTPYVASPSIFDKPVEKPESTSSDEDMDAPGSSSDAPIFSESMEKIANRYRGGTTSPQSYSTSFSPQSSPTAPSRHIKSIDDIIREYGGGLVTGKKTPSPTAAQKVLNNARGKSSSTETVGGLVSHGGVERSSFDSIQEEALMSLELESQLAAKLDKPFESPRRPQSLASGYLPRTSSSSIRQVQDDEFDVESLPGSISSSPSRLVRQNSSRSIESPEERELATLLRSARLTRLITLKKSPNRDLVVSLADVGSPTGRPVLVFLGMGCVRYLVALYDELAKLLGLRLICIDRWGLGRSTSVPDEERGYLQWASVVEEVLDELAIDRFSLLAHSAGAPYALATSLRLSYRIDGPIHLLAPWASNSVEALAGAYRFLQFVPSAVIRGVHEAEWKLQSLLLGKPPTITHEPVGYRRPAPVPTSPSSTPDRSPVRSTSATFLARLWSRKSPSVGSMNDDTASIRSATTSFVRSSTRSPKSSPPPSFPHSTSSTPTRLRRLSFHSPTKSKSTPTAPSTPTILPVTLTGAVLANGLLRASYAESMSGGTGDLMIILSEKSWGFDYRDIVCGSKVWIGDRDDRITMSSIRAMQKGLKDCEVKVVAGADHGLMTSEFVVLLMRRGADGLVAQIRRS